MENQSSAISFYTPAQFVSPDKFNLQLLKLITLLIRYRKEIWADRCIRPFACVDKRLIPTFVNVHACLERKLLECKAPANPQLPGTFVA